MVRISPQRATYLADRYHFAKVPPKSESYMLPLGIRLYNSGTGYYLHKDDANADLLEFCRAHKIPFWR